MCTSKRLPPAIGPGLSADICCLRSSLLSIRLKNTLADTKHVTSVIKEEERTKYSVKEMRLACLLKILGAECGLKHYYISQCVYIGYDVPPLIPNL